MRSILIFVILSAALVLATRYAYNHLRPPAPTNQQSQEIARTLASLPRSCHRATPPAATSKPGRVAQDYDIYSLKLYTPAQEAVASVAKLSQFKTTPEVSMRTCVSDELQYEAGVRTSDKPGQLTKAYGCIGELTYRSPSETLTLEFIEDLPDQAGCMVVNRVSGDDEVAISNDKAEARLKEGLEKKYGLLDNQSTLWGEINGANLMLTRTRTDIQLDLTDNEFTQKRDGARAKLAADASEKAKEEAKRKRKQRP